MKASEAAPPARKARRGSHNFPVVVMLFSSPAEF
jgi:hypothetical protein